MAKTDQPDEVLDLVDGQDQVIGTVTREEVAIQLLDLPGMVRAADAFVVNSQGLIFVPRRAVHKKTVPGGFDFSVGEHVGSGETYEEAMVRGFAEELGLEIRASELTRIGMLNLRELVQIPYFDAVFVYRSDVTPDYNRNDFVSHEWLEPTEFARRLEAGEPAKINILPALKLFMRTKQQRT